MPDFDRADCFLTGRSPFLLASKANPFVITQGRFIVKQAKTVRFLIAFVATTAIAIGTTVILQQATPVFAAGGQDVTLMTNLGLMKGHLMVAQELAMQKNFKDASPHFGHPVGEIYGDVEAELTQRKIPQFKDQLNALSDLIKNSPDSPKLPDTYKSAIAGVDGAIASLPAAERQSPEFVLKVMAGLLTTAASEYKAAVAEGKFVEMVEYQDSRGFVLYADELYRSVSAAHGKAHATEAAAVEKALKDLKLVWPTVSLPAAPVKTPEEVAALVQTIVAIAK